MKTPYLPGAMLSSEKLEQAVAFLDCTRSSVTSFLLDAGLSTDCYQLEVATWQLVSPGSDSGRPLLLACDRCGCWTATNTCDVCATEDGDDHG